MWEKKKLGDICKFVRGPFGGSLKKSFFVKNGLAVYEQRNAIKNQCKDFRYFITQKKFKEMSRFAVNAGDILMSCSGTIGKTTIVPKGASEGIINQALLKITPSDVLDVRFLKFYMESKIFIEQLMDTVDGAAIQNVASVKMLKKITIYLPPLNEQKLIVAKLDVAFAEIDKIILLKKKSILNLDKFFSNQLNSLFLDNSNNWESTTLGAYYDVRDGTHDSPKYVSQGIPLVTSKNLKNGMIDLTKIKYIKNEDYLLIKKRSGVSIGDVLMAMIGTIGNPVIIKNDNEFAIKNVALFKIKENQSSDFLKYYLDSAFVKNKMMKDSKGTTQQFVGLGYLRNFPIKVPSFEKQQVISLKIMSLEKNIDDLKNKYNLILKNYISLKNSLLTELLNKSKAA